jgi:hypothetical protein
MNALQSTVKRRREYKDKILLLQSFLLSTPDSVRRETNKARRKLDGQRQNRRPSPKVNKA